MKRSVLAFVIAGLLAAALAPSAAATTTRTSFTSTGTFADVLDEGDSGQAGNMAWARGVVWLTNDVGSSTYVTGPDTVGFSYNLNLITGNGALWGWARLAPTAFPGGAFNCSWYGIFDSFVWTGKQVCHGEGVLDGYQIRETLVAAPGGAVVELSGFVFTPGG